MLFYVVKGAPNSCGLGCDSWVAMEGQIDAGAAPRFRKFLRQLNGRNLPFYFASPGGNLDQALAMGAMLREKPTIARVARTVVSDCGFEAQDSDVCRKLKQSGRELHGELTSRDTNCNSACPYLMLGATTREIAPDAVIAVHSPKVVVHFRTAATPSREMRAAATERGLDRADRMLRSYIVRMGADIGLLELARTIRFEDTRVLTREEIARFGIDRRELAETPWVFESGNRSILRKIISQKGDGDGAYRLTQWRLFCFNSELFELDFQRPSGNSSVIATIQISNSGSMTQFYKSAAVGTGGFELWGVRVPRDSLQALIDEPLEITETLQTQDGRRRARKTRFSSDGMAGALDRLLATCPPAKSANAIPAAITRESAAK